MKNKSNDRLVSRTQDDRFNADVKLAEHLHMYFAVDMIIQRYFATNLYAFY